MRRGCRGLRPGQDGGPAPRLLQRRLSALGTGTERDGAGSGLCAAVTPRPQYTHVGAVTSFHRDGAGSAAAFRRGLPAPLAPSPALGRHPRSARHCPLRTSARFLQPPGGPGPRPHAEDCLRLTRCDDQNRNSAPPDVNLPLSFVATPPHAPPSSWLLSKMAEQEAGSNARQVTRADRPRKGPGPGPGGCGRRAPGSALGPRAPDKAFLESGFVWNPSCSPRWPLLTAGGGRAGSRATTCKQVVCRTNASSPARGTQPPRRPGCSGPSGLVSGGPRAP